MRHVSGRVQFMRTMVAGLGIGAGAAGGALTVSPLDVAAQSGDDARAEALVSNWIEALGGMDAYSLLRSARYTLTTEMYDADTGRLRRTRPRYVTVLRSPQGELAKIERWEGDDFIEQRWDGSTEWAQLNGENLAAGHRDFDQVPYVSGDVNYWIALPFKLHDGGVNLHDRGKDDQGRDHIGVSFGEGVGLHDGDSWQYWFVEGRTWPVEIAYQEEGRTSWNYLSFEDIKTVDGYTFVGRRVYHNEDGQLIKVLYTHDFELNPDVDPSFFAGSR
jgi:hypothetical protein